VDRWHAGHVGAARVDGGSDYDVQAECVACNLVDGARIGGRRRAARRRTTRVEDQRLVEWR
jgi:hypothetical protein